MTRLRWPGVRRRSLDRFRWFPAAKKCIFSNSVQALWLKHSYHVEYIVTM